MDIKLVDKIEKMQLSSNNSWIIFANGKFGSGKTTFLKNQKKILKKNGFKVSDIVNAPGIIELEFKDSKKNLLQFLFPGWYLTFKLLKLARFVLSIAVAFISFEWIINNFKKIPSLYQFGLIGGSIIVIFILIIFNENFFINLRFIRNKKQKKIIILLDDFDRLSLVELRVCLKLIEWLKNKNKVNFIVTGSEELFANQYSKLITGLPKIKSQNIFIGGHSLSDKICQNKVEIE